MSRYYEAKDVEIALIFSGLCDGKTCGEIKKVLNSIPTIDRPQGEWISKHNGYWTCSECGLSFLFYAKGNYCPNCGAHMKGVDDE